MQFAWDPADSDDNPKKHGVDFVEATTVFGDPFALPQFNDGTEQTIDFRSVLEGELFGPLSDLGLFNRVELDEAFAAIQWPTGADFDPETLHDWPRYREGVVGMARRWALAGTPSAKRAGEPPNAADATCETWRRG